jgi:hypothetical protein
VADWHICDSGGLVINHNPQFFTTFIVRAAGVTFHDRVLYIISGELVYTWGDGKVSRLLLFLFSGIRRGNVLLGLVKVIH